MNKDTVKVIFTGSSREKLTKMFSHVWAAFQAMDRVPQFVRSLVERMVLNPGLGIQQAQEQLLEDVYPPRRKTPSLMEGI